MGLQNGAEIGHDLRSQVGRQVQEGAVVAVTGKVVVGEAHAHKRVRILPAGDTDVDLFRKRIAHGFPVDMDAGALLKGVQDFVAFISAGEGRDPAHNFKFRLFRVGVHGPIVDVDHQTAGAARQEGQGQKRGQKFHFHHASSFLSPTMM